MSICQSIVQAINRSISPFFFSLTLSQLSPTYPTALSPPTVFLSAAKQQAGSIVLPLSSNALGNFYWLSLRSGCSAPVNRFLQLLVLCRTVPASFVFLRRNPLAPRHSFDPTIFCCIARVALIHHLGRFDADFPSSPRSIFPRRLADFLARSPPSEALIWHRHWTQPGNPPNHLFTLCVCVCVCTEIIA